MDAERELDQASLQRLVDESDLRKLVLAYARFVDARDGDSFGSLFTEDAVFEVVGFKRVGRKAIAAGPKNDFTNRYERTMHYVCNMYFDIEGDEARILAYMLVPHVPSAADSARHADAGGWNHMVARRTDKGWLIAEMRAETVWTAGIPLQF